jgi:hypothetical protein
MMRSTWGNVKGLYGVVQVAQVAALEVGAVVWLRSESRAVTVASITTVQHGKPSLVRIVFDDGRDVLGRAGDYVVLARLGGVRGRPSTHCDMWSTGRIGYDDVGPALAF